MRDVGVTFDSVWKKFRRGERHDTLRDAAIARLRRPFGGGPARETLAENEFWVIRNLSFKVEPGHALGIIGPNGAGKSTTLKLLSRILKPTLGECSVVGRVGALIEVAAGFHPDLTGRENMYLQGAILGLRREEVTRKLDAIVEFSGVSEFIDTPIKRYSSGMNARLGFAIAAHMDPDVLLIDEVLAVGDFVFQQKCYARMEEFRRSGAAIVFVSHNMQAIMSLCDRALLLRPRSEPLIGPVEEVAAAYASTERGAHDPRVSIQRFDLTVQGEPSPLSGAVPPGAPLRLDIELQVNTDFPRCCVYFEVVRTDGLKMFNHTPMVEGLRPLDLSKGDVLTTRIDFNANMLRGTYRILFYMDDAEHRYQYVEVSGLASFVVHETTRNAGCAELQPAYSIAVKHPQVAV